MTPVTPDAAPCPEDDVLVRWLDGRLPLQEISALQLHVDGCPDCLSLLVELARPQPGAASLAMARTVSAPEPEPASGAEVPAQVEEFRILRPLGQGGMGQVFLARDTLLDRLVAIKFPVVPKPSDEARERFLVEARAIARLSHKNVVSVYRVGEVAGRPYLVSELVPGRSLDRLPLPLPAERVVRIGLGLCGGIGVAHRCGVLHRDIKPANVILCEDGEVKLLDFGLAKLLGATYPPEPEDLAPGGDPAGSAALTRTGAILGTPHYMAPEIWRREAATERSDIYSLGALLYELCAGRPPQMGRTLRELRRATQRREIRPLREVAPGVEATLSEIVARCLRRDPEERFASVDELGQALWALLEPGGLPAAAVVASTRDRSALRGRRAGPRALCLARGAEISAVLDLLHGAGLVVLAGDVGVGKSSLCCDGVLPAVESGALGDGRTWSSLHLVPGPSPLLTLAEALAPGLGTRPKDLLERLRGEPAAVVRQLTERHQEQGSLLLFFDQAEELLTRSDAREAAAAGELLGQIGAQLWGVRVLLAVRGEFLVRLAALPGLGPLLVRALHLLLPLSAATAFAQAQRLRPDDPATLRRMGAAYRALEKHDAAAAILERAVACSPQDSRARTHLALVYAASGHLGAAIAQAAEIVRLDAGAARSLRLLGRLSLKAQGWEEARSALERAVALDPGHRLAHRWLGEALLALGEATEAATHFEKAAELGLARLRQSACAA